VSKGTATVWQLDAVDLPDRSYLAPELRNPALGQAGPATDLYGLGRLAWELFDSGTAGGAEPTPATPPPTAMPAGLAELVRGLLQAHPAGRPADASEMLATIERLRGSGEERRVTPPKPEYEVGDLINNDFEVREILGSGGFRFVYRVYRAVDDCEFALKVYNAGGFEEARREVTILRSIGPHPNIEEIVWADRTSQGQWYLLTKLVEGEPLGEYARGGKRLSVDEVRRVGDQLLAALEAIHPDQRRIAELETAGRGRTLTQAEYDELRDLKARGIVHRDVKPHNLMRAADGVVLIDFNIASLAGAPAATQSGTPRYQAPDATGFPEWNPSVDLFAAGVTLYELLCGEHPYEGAVPTAALRARDPRIFRPELSGELAAFLLKACAPHADQRYASATDMRDAWAAIESFVVPTDRQRRSGIAPRLTDLLDAAPPNVTPMVTELLGLCSQARRSNRETRGLSDLAESTYVETRLDRDLADAVLAGRHRLVIVTGNAGDGKTAFIQKTESRAKQLGATVEQEGPDGRVMRLAHDGRLLRTLYDGSEDEQGASQRTSDEVLGEFLAPFAADGREDGAVRVAAINEGRLRDFIGMHADRFSGLLDLLGELDEPGRTRRDELLLVNLNLRSVTAGGADSILSQQIRVIVEGPFWKPCQDCDFRTRCPIKHNVDTFADPDSGAEVTERLRRLADLVRLRRRRHLTMRDVRSLISFVLFRDRDCHEIAELLAGPDPMAVVDLAYFQAVGGLGIPPGTALEQNAALLAEADVAAVANPADDRALATRKDIARLSFSRRESDFFHQQIAEVYEQAGRGYEADREGVLRAHAALRRLAYFERRDERWLEMLPYKQLPEMERALAPEGGPDRTALRDRLVQALSAAQGMGSPLDHQVALWLATGDAGDGSDGLRGFRRFPAGDFELRIAHAAAPYLEAEPDQLELVCQPGRADSVLPVDLDVLELLDRLREGYMPSVDERRGLLVHIELFFNRLRVLANRELLLVADERLYRIAAQPGGIIELTEVQS
jgi:Protein kinase domain